MIVKTIDGVNNFLYSCVVVMFSFLGVYSAYEILFSLDIPTLASVSLIIGAFFFSYFASVKKKK